MKHFIVKQTETQKRGDTTHTTHTTLWAIRNNKPVKLGERASQFEAPQQALMNLVEDTKALPEQYLKEHPMGGRNYLPHSLKTLGVAEFHYV